MAFWPKIRTAACAIALVVSIVALAVLGSSMEIGTKRIVVTAFEALFGVATAAVIASGFLADAIPPTRSTRSMIYFGTLGLAVIVFTIWLLWEPFVGNSGTKATLWTVNSVFLVASIVMSVRTFR